MIILDTNVVSEPVKPSANPAVIAWLDRQHPETLYLTATSLAELLTGVELLPEGRRRMGLSSALQELIARLFGARILPFDEVAAASYASIVGLTRAHGKALSIGDAQIAAIAKLHGFAVATRDREPLLHAGIQVIDPWRQ